MLQKIISQTIRTQIYQQKSILVPLLTESERQFCSKLVGPCPPANVPKPAAASTSVNSTKSTARKKPDFCSLYDGKPVCVPNEPMATAKFPAFTLETEFNQQITNEFNASHLYLALANFSASNDRALNGCAAFFHHLSTKEREHACKLMEYQRQRGASIELNDIAKPNGSDCKTIVDAFSMAIETEVDEVKVLEHLCSKAQAIDDVMSTEFLAQFLSQQMHSIDEINRILAKLASFGKNDSSGLGIYLIDKDLLKKYGCKYQKVFCGKKNKQRS